MMTRMMIVVTENISEITITKQHPLRRNNEYNNAVCTNDGAFPCAFILALSICARLLVCVRACLVSEWRASLNTVECVSPRGCRRVAAAVTLRGARHTRPHAITVSPTPDISDTSLPRPWFQVASDYVAWRDSGNTLAVSVTNNFIYINLMNK